MVAPLVLVVEDDPLSLKLMRDVLQANGYRTVEATTGTDAVALAFSESPAAVVMDIGLPGLDGVEATKQIKSASSVPVIAVTAYAMPGDEERMRAAGGDVFLTKPLRFADFLQVLEGVLAASTATQASGSEK
jgi:two-component system cell cycle response regulator DivK